MASKGINRIKSLGAGSAKYGSCEVCCQHVSETFLPTTKSEQAAHVLAALEAEPMDDEDGRAAVAELGIDAKRLAAGLRALVVTQAVIDAQQGRVTR